MSSQEVKKVPFNELLEYLGESPEDAKLAKRLNRLVKNKGLKIYFSNADAFPLNLLIRPVYSEIAHTTHAPLLVKHIQQISIFDKLHKDFTETKELLIEFDLVEYGGVEFYPADQGPLVDGGKDLLPEGMQTVFLNESIFKPFYYPGISKNIGTDFYLLEDDFKSFKAIYERDKANGANEKRRSLLKNFLSDEGYNVSKKLKFGEHKYKSRKELYFLLYEKYGEPLFHNPYTSNVDETIKKLFDNNDYIAFR